jgi:PKD repeat protein
VTTASATFTDPGSDAPYGCTVNYGDGSGAFAGAVTGNTCTGPAHAYTGVGTYTVTVNVTDKDGASGTKSSTHSVLYTFSGFFQPVDNPPALNRVKAGLAVPVRFSLNGNRGVNIFEAGYPTSEPLVCQSSGIDDIEETTNAATSSLSFNPSTGQYTYLWKTDTSWANTCRQLVVKFADGTIQRAKFRFVK